MRDVVSPNETTQRTSQGSPVRVVHYLNQFFGGIGGEQHADHPVEVRAGAIGPGRALERDWDGAATVVATVIAGDNYVSTFAPYAEAAIRIAFETHPPDVLVAGPAFNACSYGMGCA